ncbi:MAG: homocysteine S-methyltransferase family protein, partial [Anaeromyxobacteraceae bacterium]
GLSERPEAIAAVHAAHRAAGAQVLLTCTFSLASPRLAAEVPGVSAIAMARAAVSLARGAGGGARVAGAFGPAWGGAPGADLERALATAGRALADAGADLLWIESQRTWPEASLAAAAARGTGLPFALTFTFRPERGALVDAEGVAAEECLALAAEAGALAVGSNCDLPGTPVAALLARASRRVAVPLVAKPSAGLPGAVVAPEAFAAWAAELSRAGAAFVGGCCGAGSEHLAAAARALGATA